MLKAVIFDLDNTLIDYMTMKRTAVAGAIRAMQDAGLDMGTRKAARMIYGLYDIHGIEYQRIFQIFLRKATGNVDYRILASAIVGYRRAEASAMRPYPKVKFTLTRLKEQKIRLAILTDAPRMRAWMRLAELDLADFFDMVVCLEDTGVEKPDKKPFLFMLKKLRISPKEVLMVGDAIGKDIRGAKAVGMRTCHAKYGEVGKIMTVKPDFTIRRIDQLLKVVERC
jgi:HAD superfamily hydrolase (TIGR02253 family)